MRALSIACALAFIVTCASVGAKSSQAASKPGQVPSLQQTPPRPPDDPAGDPQEQDQPT